MNIPCFIGLRYTRAKRRNHFISFISLSSLLGIALGVMVLIVVLSVMNGFDQQIRSHIFGMASQVNVLSMQEGVKYWPRVAKQAKQLPHVVAAAPFVSGQGLLSHNGHVQAVMVKGVFPDKEREISALREHMQLGHVSLLAADQFRIVLGDSLANRLGVTVGDDVTLVVPTPADTKIGVEPRYEAFRVVGIFHIGHGFGFDSSWAFVHMRDAQAMWKMPHDRVTGVQLKLDDVYLAPEVTQQLSQVLPPDYLITNWTLQYGPFFRAIAMEKTMMFLILLLIVAVAAFNLVSSLVMAVTDKQSDIAILRTLGATPGMICRIFMMQGTLTGIIGTAVGIGAGVWLANHATVLADRLQHWLHVQWISSNVYFVDFLPSKLSWHDVGQVALVAIICSFVATWYPAWRAARVQPAEALRYE
ncbi:MAG: lipoprotein ABC transporter [marine bacterium B5-7]|nr:MAG: lipoprotein ABC transporter [marine bacterium B5-7]